MSVNLDGIAAASFLPGLQNSGQISGTALISGTLYSSPDSAHNNTSNLTGQFIVNLPDPQVIGQFRVNLPDANGQLASRWFPLIGVAELTDNTAHWRLILYLLANSQGRQVNFNFVNLRNNQTSFTNFRVNIYGHLYSYPWDQTALQ